MLFFHQSIHPLSCCYSFINQFIHELDCTSKELESQPQLSKPPCQDMKNSPISFLSKFSYPRKNKQKQCQKLRHDENQGNFQIVYQSSVRLP